MMVTVKLARISALTVEGPMAPVACGLRVLVITLQLEVGEGRRKERATDSDDRDVLDSGHGERE